MRAREVPVAGEEILTAFARIDKLRQFTWRCLHGFRSQDSKKSIVRISIEMEFV